MLTRLLVLAHGTASPAGSATTARLIDAIRAARASVPVELCFLDVASPSLTASLDERPTVLLPLLLSTGYHVQADIPAAVAGLDRTVVARHLGPHPLLVDVLVDRLPAGSDPVVLVGAGSSRGEAVDELRTTGRMLTERVGSPVDVLTMGDDLRAAFAAHARVRVATYLLAEGQFVDTLRAAADGLGAVAEPLGVHPALVALAWLRYDEACAGLR
jgi:Uncharacterized conserved protein